MQASKKLQNYFKDIDERTQKALKLATAAREKGFDPEKHVDIPIAKNMAERVLGLISDLAPDLKNSNMVNRIIELEEKYSPLDWRVGFEIAAEVAKQKFCTFETKKEAVEIGIRTGFIYLTGGIVSAPLEGFVEVRIKKRADGKEYLACVYAGPIRAAGGTAAATSVVLSDYVASQMGYAKYDPTDQEISRAVTELTDYNERVTNLQYFPSEEEIRFMVKNLPIEVDGEQTERIEVSNYKDIPRIETNLIRGGVCLVLGEGLCQKTPKIWKRLSKWGKDLGIDWTFMDEFLKIQKKIKAKGVKKEASAKLSPNFTFINDLVAGRPVLTYPMAYGGFRLRMGRTRTSGFSCSSINPLTLSALNDFIVYGTQMKIERPGKACSVTMCECLEGPIVKLIDGQVVQITNENKDLIKKIDKILFLGDILINYGDFSENGHSLVPIGYCEEWWIQELEKRITDIYGTLDFEKASSLVSFDLKRFEDVFNIIPTFNEARVISEKLDLPLYPKYIYFYIGLTLDDLEYLYSICKEYVQKQPNAKTIDLLEKIIIPTDEKLKDILETAGIPHTVGTDNEIILASEDVKILSYTLDLQNPTNLVTPAKAQNPDITVLDLINILSPVTIQDKAGTFIGARMGRPEKAKMRKLQGSPQVLFPVGEEGGRLKCFQSAIEAGEITANFPLYYDEESKKRTVYSISHLTNKPAKRMYHCPSIGKDITTDTIPTDKDEFARTYNKITINIKEYVKQCLDMMDTKVYPDLIKGIKTTSNKEHIPEHLIKGFLRAKHDIYVNKDGTTRYDMSETPITAFKPNEIGASIKALKSLGYTTDIDGNPIESDDQVIEIFPQDVILPDAKEALEEQAGDVLLRTGNFVDDELHYLYKLKRFYNFKDKSDVIGHLIICLAPHISCGTVGRIIGFSKNQVMAAHPMMHAALRRDCDGDEACFILLMDAFLNFSRQFLPDRRGGRTMDAPLVLSSKIIPSEVDDQVHGVDKVKRYPLELYEAGSELKMPWDVPVTQLKDHLNTEEQYEGFYATHPIKSINSGPVVSAYKVLPSMSEKLEGQMELARRICAVKETNVATMVIQKHFLKDIKGNLRKFSQQQFRCVKCNAKFRRIPLTGVCTHDSGKLIFTISEGSVIKYLEPSLNLARKYGVEPYLKQTLDLTQERVDSVFGKEKEIQEGLDKFF